MQWFLGPVDESQLQRDLFVALSSLPTQLECGLFSLLITTTSKFPRVIRRCHKIMAREADKSRLEEEATKRTIAIPTAFVDSSSFIYLRVY